MSDTPPEIVDTGFDAVAAGEVYVSDPAPVVDTPQNYAEQLPTGDPAGAGAGDVTVAVTAPGLTPAGLDAAKNLVNLPKMSPPELAQLAREVAMNIKPLSAILQDFKLNDTQYEFLEEHNEFFKAALHAACIEWARPLSTPERIKIEAAAILEDSLVGLGARMQNKGEGLPGVVEVAKLFSKIAGVGEREAGPGNPGERFVINIDLGGDKKITLGNAPAETPADREVVDGAPARITGTQGRHSEV